jgi:glycosyltransferase involved in cell wall biosynthesis
MKQKTACFFCKVKSRDVLERVGYYAQDIAILRDLGYEVHIATRPQELVPADLYYGWWWTWGFVPASYAMLRRKPIVLTGVFDLWCFDARPRLHRALHRFALKHAHANVFISVLERDQVAERFKVRQPIYSPLTVDIDLYRPVDRTTERPGEPYALTFAGTGMNNGNSHRKCIPELIRAAPLIHARFPRLRFVIAGNKGTDYPELAALAQEVGAADYIEFPGVVSVERKVELMQNCAVYLQPTRFEGFGLSLLEAMSCGAAVVSSPAGAVPEVLGDCGALADGTDPEAFATRVVDLLADGRRLEQMRRSARQRAVEQFSYERRKNDVHKIITGLAA